MIDISIQNIKKAFEEGNDILDGISFDINEGERVGLFGKNGAGKTTLLRVITGEITEDEGNVIIPSVKKIGLISQIPTFPAGFTSEDVLRSAFDYLISIQAEMEEIEKSMAENASPSLLKKYDGLAFEFERLGGYTMEIELNRVVNGLRIPHDQRTQLFDTLSGGEKTRINLARLILENTDILLLDEPTNHLDMRATTWLEEFIAKFRGTVLIISHDRYFLDRTIGRAIEIVNGKAEFYSGNYSFYVQEKQRRYEEQLEKYEREQAESKRLHAAADRLKQWGTGNEALMKKSFAIRTRAERAVKTDRPDREKTMRTRITQKEFRGDEALVVRGLSKSFDNRQLFNIDELEVHGGERIAIIGDNGTGKTTLVKIIIGEQKPDTGFARYGPAIKAAYLPQSIHFDNPYRSIIDTLIYEQNESPQTARNRLGAYLFSGEDVFKCVGDLSGGEKSRLRLCMLMNGEINLLILDEPTNHLDLPSREWIEDAVANFDETLLFISHDRYFIDRFATRIWEFEGDTFTDFCGTYQQLIEYKEKGTTLEKVVKFRNNSHMQDVQSEHFGNEGQSPKPVKQKSKKPTKKPSDTQKELRRIEREIEKLETNLADIKTQKEEHSTDYEKLMELDNQELQVQEELDALLEDWERSLSACEGLK